MQLIRFLFPEGGERRAEFAKGAKGEGLRLNG
jgi:hypothetical protein